MARSALAHSSIVTLFVMHWIRGVFDLTFRKKSLVAIFLYYTIFLNCVLTNNEPGSKTRHIFLTKYDFGSAARDHHLYDQYCLFKTVLHTSESPCSGKRQSECNRDQGTAACGYKKRNNHGKYTKFGLSH